MKKTRGFQVVVIGGGSAGHAAATTAAAAGAATVLVESAPVLGGLCILRGCMPSKTLIETADRLREMFEGLGSRVTILARGPSIMKGMDPDVAQELAAAGEERGIEILRNSPVERVGFEDGCFTVRLEGGRRSLEADVLLVATGRSPATRDLGLEQTGLSMQDGRILIDENAAASVPGFFAAGDCASPAAVVHLAVMQGIVAGKNAVRSLQQSRAAAPAVWKTRPAMRAWFTSPQCVQVGLSQEEAEERGLGTVQGRQDLADHGKGMIAGERHGFVKVILDRRSGRILGASGVGPQVVESGHLLEAAIDQDLTAAEYLAVPNYHPTFVEAWSRAVEKALAQCPAAGSRKPG